MKNWQEKFENEVRKHDAPSVFTRDLISRFARTARNQYGEQGVPASSLSHWIKRMTERGKLQLVQRGIYLNRMRSNPGVLADAIPLLQRDAVVSLNTVLGEVGVLNNPSRVITAVVPIDLAAPPPSRLGRRQTQAGIVHFYGMPRSILEAGSAEDRLESMDAFDHPRATPEKALIDWLYLGASPRSRRTPPPRSDIDLDMLNGKRLRRLAKAASLEQQLNSFSG